MYAVIMLKVLKASLRHEHTDVSRRVKSETRQAFPVRDKMCLSDNSRAHAKRP